MIDDQLLREYAEAVRSDVTAPSFESVRHRAQRRRRRQGAAGAIVVAVVTAGVVVPIALLHNGSGGDRRAQVVISSPSPTPSTSGKYALPALGAAGFPASVYPLPHRGLQPGTIPTCPSAAGVRVPDLPVPPDVTTQPLLSTVKRLESRSFRSDLRHTDRAYWPAIQAGWRAHSRWQTPSAPRKPSRVFVLYGGPLYSLDQPTGIPDLRPFVREACGEQTLRDTIVWIYGSRPNPNQARALQSADLFVVRHGRPLLYFSYP